MSNEAILQQHYHLDATNVISQQGGWAALAYRVTTEQQNYFLKVYEKHRASTSKWTALIDKYVPILLWLMASSSLQGKVPVPLLTKDGEFKCEDEDGIYLLYEYIDGETIGDQPLNEQQIIQLAEIIAELHTFGAEIPVETAAIKEDFAVPFLQQLADVLDKGYIDMPADIKEVVEPHIDQIFEFIAKVEKLAIVLQNSDLKMVLCHTDIHPWNLMQSALAPQLLLIDWEGLKLAPVEADFMSLVDEPYYADFLTTYQKTYKDFKINPAALQFYQARRRLEDIWEFMEQLLFDQQTGEARTHTINSLAKELREMSS